MCLPVLTLATDIYSMDGTHALTLSLANVSRSRSPFSNLATAESRDTTNGQHNHTRSLSTSLSDKSLPMPRGFSSFWEA